MFLAILSYMLAHVPGFIRPAVNWLLDGLRSITNYISQRWNALGDAMSGWYSGAVAWAMAVTEFAANLGTFVLWLVLVRIPGVIAVAVNAVTSYLVGVVRGATDALTGLVAQVKAWAGAWIDWLGARLAELRTFAREWIDRLTGTLTNLIRLLGHVLNGPVVLAEWLVGAMWRAMLRLLYQERDRIFSWLTRESVAFTRWITLELENIIMRWL